MKAAKRRSSTGQIWMVAGGATVVLGLLIGASVWSANQREANQPVVVNMVKSDAELGASGMTLGKPEAKVHLVEYGDFL